MGTFQDGIPLANITIAGAAKLPKNLNLHIDGSTCDSSVVSIKTGGNTTYITGLENVTKQGAWYGNMTLKLTY